MRGAVDRLQQNEVRKLIQEHKLSLVGLVETKVKEVNKERVLRALATDWNVVCNYNHSLRGRIWVCWNPAKLDLSVISQNEQVIHCVVREIANSWSCIISIAYGENCYRNREFLWDDLLSFADSIRGRPWPVAGDFNAVRRINERVGGSPDWPSWMGP